MLSKLKGKSKDKAVVEIEDDDSSSSEEEISSFKHVTPKVSLCVSFILITNIYLFVNSWG